MIWGITRNASKVTHLKVTVTWSEFCFLTMQCIITVKEKKKKTMQCIIEAK